MTYLTTRIHLATLETLADLLLERVGLDYREHRLEHLVFPLRRRMRALGLEDPQAYLQKLRQDPQEWQAFVNAVTVLETRFYRYPDIFQALVSTVLPELARQRPLKTPIVLWSMATATGAEAYTLAMTALESGITLFHPVRVLGTDINTDALTQAKEARYPEFIVAPLPDDWKQRYLRRNPDGTFSPKPAVRALVQFKYFNLKTLADGAPLPVHADVAFCANVLMYLQRETAYGILRALANHMPCSGYICIGYAEMFLARNILKKVRVGDTILFRPPCQNEKTNG